MQPLQRNPREYPRFRQNILHLYSAAETARLFYASGQFELPLSDANKLMLIRGHCTGFNSVEEIAQKSGIPRQEVACIAEALADEGLLHGEESPGSSPTPGEVREALRKICSLWGDELRLLYIGNRFAAGDLPKPVLVGWLLEMYHYIRDCPLAIGYAASLARGPLKEVLLKYASEESGHESFVLKALMRLGLSREAVEASTPLVSTRLIGYTMRDLAQIAPGSMLLMAAMVEAQEFNPEGIQEFTNALIKAYDIPADALEPIFEHQKIDVEMGHAQLLDSNLDLIDITDRAVLDKLVDRLHDLKHAFELQNTEIAEYYSDCGRLVPRLPVAFQSI
ncbi:hypothetical protein HMI49_09025 [Corallococcus exercitus]|uniref:Thiaminase-2/PQQC domain-containing protein n=1 Tax=Corallococcus exercitus TaxID=2316736 RepID=A0A7Y4NR51_9BACT|nr:iron-containing redox enzyme family protein [Corallococcus exercitus]NOK33336.1 hypothetical protein [Corallococcus exercitus]